MKRKRTTQQATSKGITAKTVSTAELCKLKDVARDTVMGWTRKGMPTAFSAPGKPSLFSVEAVDRWLAEQGLQQAADLESPKTRAEADLALVLQKIRKERANADKAELGVKVRRAELLEAAEVEAGRLGRIAAVKAGLSALAAQLSARLPGRPAPEVERIVEEEVRRLLEAFAGTSGGTAP